MKVTQKHIDESGVVTLSVTANSQEVDKALDAAQLGFARQMGVRPKHGTPIAQSVKEQLGITNGQYSKLSAYYYLSYSLSCIAVGFLSAAA